MRVEYLKHCALQHEQFADAMKTTDSQDQIAKDAEQMLDKVLRDAIVQSEEARRKISKRRWFGIGVIALAPFCIVVAMVIWPTASQLDKLQWLFYALVLLIVGAWQVDLAGKEENLDARGRDGSTPTSAENSLSRKKHNIRIIR